METIKDLYWAAGFLEGEGSFHVQQPAVRAGQVQREPLERLQKLFGGSVKDYKYISVWTLCGAASIGVMLTVYSLMSPRRKQQITKVINDWKKRPGYGHNRRDTTCKRGHVYESKRSDGRNRCNACERITYHERKAA